MQYKQKEEMWIDLKYLQHYYTITWLILCTVSLKPNINLFLVHETNKILWYKWNQDFV